MIEKDENIGIEEPINQIEENDVNLDTNHNLIEQPDQSNVLNLDHKQANQIQAANIQKLDYATKNKMHLPTRKVEENFTVVGSQTKNSKFMLKVKETVGQVNRLLNSYSSNSQKKTISKDTLLKLEENYVNAILACDDYIQDKKNRILYTNERLYKVQNTKEIFEQELAWLRILNRKTDSDTLNLEGKGIIDFIYEAQKEALDPVEEIEFKDYLNVLSDVKDDRVVCRAGKLCKVAEKDRTKEDAEINHENYDMALRLVNLLIDRQATVSDATKYKMKVNLLFRLGVDINKKLCGPIVMEDLRAIIIESGSKLSKVDSTLLHKKKVGEDEVLIADQVNKLLGSAFTKPSKMRRKEYEIVLKSQIRDIMTFCWADKEKAIKADRRYPWPMLATMKGYEDFVLAGQIQAVRDKVYESALRIYKGRQIALEEARKQNSKAQNPKVQEQKAQMLSEKELKILFGMVISQTLANRDPRVIQSQHDYDMLEYGIERFERAHISKDKKQAARIINGLKKEQKSPDLEKMEFVAETEATARAMEDLSSKTQSVTGMFIDRIKPTDLIKSKRSKTGSSILKLYKKMKNLATNPKAYFNITVSGVKMEFRTDENGMLILRANKKDVILPGNAAIWSKKLEVDIAGNLSRFKMEDAKSFLHEVAKNGINSDRSILTEFLRGCFKNEADAYINLSVSSIADVILKFTSKNDRVRNFNNIKVKLDELVALSADKDFINAAFVDENVLAYHNRLYKEVDKINDLKEFGKKQEVQRQVVNFEGYQEEDNWTPKQRKALDLISELYYNSKTWNKYEGKDNKEAYTKERIISVLKKNKEGFDALLNNGSEVAGYFNWIPLLKDASIPFSSFIEAVKDLQKNNPTVDVFEALNADNKIVSELCNGMNNAVTAVSGKMQKEFKEMASQMGTVADVDRWKSHYEWSLDKILEHQMTGEDGEAGFNKEVLSNYIESASMIDKSNMLASALKNAPKVKDALQELKDTDKIQGRFLSGFIKGAGPLLHKMMQQLPVSDMDPIMQETVNDVRCNLAKIDEEIIDAQLDKMVRESNGKIEKIVKKNILGAASVGQTIEVLIFEPGAKEGKERVIKFLRPNVDNRMKRERDFMLKCARNVDKKAWEKRPENRGKNYPKDEIGGMEKTYINKLRSIQEELNLTGEADNILAGQIYNDPDLHIKAMKLDKDFPKYKEMIVLEKAEGDTVTGYSKKKDLQLKQICEDIEKQKGTDSGYEGLKKLYELRKELLSKKPFLDNLMAKWGGEALFESGYFHGDLHAGNIMIDDEGVTVIDFGNASKLEKDEQTHVINLLAAANTYRCTTFLDHFRALMDDTNRNLYDNYPKKQELDDKIRDIIKKEEDEPAKKMLAVVNEFQQAGIEMPKSLYSFIQCLTRMVGTLKDYNALIEKVDGEIDKVLKYEGVSNLENNPAFLLLPKIISDIKTDIAEQKKGQPEYEIIVNKEKSKLNIGKNIDDYANDVQITISPIVTITKDVSTMNNLEELNAMLNNSMYSSMKLNENELLKGLLLAISGRPRLVGNAYRLFYDDVTEFEKEYKHRKSEYNVWMLINFICYQISDKRGFVISKYSKNGKKINDDDLMNEIAKPLNDLRDEVTRKIKDKELTVNEVREYTKKCIDCLNKVLDSLEGDKESINFIKALVEYIFKSYHGRDEFKDEDKHSFDVTKKDRVDIEAKNPEIKAARENLETAIKELYIKTEGGRNKAIYRNKLINQVILDENKFKVLGKSLQSWFNDTNNKGNELKEAYEAIQSKYDSEIKLKEDSVEINKFVNIYLECLKGRAENIREMEYQRTSQTEQNPLNDMVRGYQGKIWHKLDCFGIGYLIHGDYKLTKLQKDNKTLESINRKTEARRALAQSLNQCDFARTEKRFCDLINDIKDEENKSEAEIEKYKSELHRLMTKLLQDLLDNVAFMESEKKEIKCEVNKFSKLDDDNDLVEHFFNLMVYANSIIKSNLEGTIYDYSLKEYDKMKSELSSRDQRNLKSLDDFNDALDRVFGAQKQVRLTKNERISSKLYYKAFENTNSGNLQKADRSTIINFIYDKKWLKDIMNQEQKEKQEKENVK